MRAIAIKNNYTPALFLLSQIEIQLGNTEQAITTTRAIIRMEPENPTRYFQLGLLLSANGETEAAIDAFESAIARNDEYANARYLLAIAYAEQGRFEEALAQLRVVEETNPENENLLNLIAQLEAGEVPELATSTVTTPVEEPDTDPAEGLNAESVPDDTALVESINQAGEDESVESQPPVDAGSSADAETDLPAGNATDTEASG